MVEGVDFHSSRILSVCSGVGQLDTGIRVALPRSRVVCCVEHEAYAAHVLASRMEDEALDAAPIWTNLRTFDGRPWRGLVDGIVGGYPCQPFSQAGKRLGAEDPRHLWPEILRLIGEVEPGWCWFENVRGHLTKGFDVVYRDLRAAGYRVKAGLFSAEEVGASHQRERLFILAMADTGDGRLPVPWRGSEGRDGSGSESAKLVDPDSFRRGEGPCHVQAGRDAAEAAGYEMADGHGTGRRWIRTAHDEVRIDAPRNDADGCDPALANTKDDHGRCGERGAEAGARPGELGRRGSSGSGGEVANAEPEGLQGPGPEEPARRSVPPSLRGDWGASSLPIFAPGPGDVRIWGRVVEDGSTNGLAPSTQPGVRMLADGVALVVDESRRDQLRAIGNGVVPLQASFAFSVLTRKMGVVI